MKLIRSYNPLVMPWGRLPGFDTSHRFIQAGNTTPNAAFSGVSALTSNAYFSLITGKKNNFTGGTASVVTIDPIIGPSQFYSTTAESQLFQPMGGNSTFHLLGWTQAGILRPTTIGAAGGFQATGGSFQSGAIGLNSTGFLVLNMANSSLVFTSAVIQLQAGHPYFICISADCPGGNGVNTGTGPSQINLLALDLSNGQIFIDVQSSVTGDFSTTYNNSGVGDYVVGTSGISTFKTFVGNHAAAACLPTFLSINDMLQWAADPWSFWYPPNQQQIMFSGLQGSQDTLMAQAWF